MKVSVSVGAAFYPDDGKDFKTLYTACDTALYHSKKIGKDTYSFYDSEKESGGEQ